MNITVNNNAYKLYFSHIINEDGKRVTLCNINKVVDKCDEYPEGEYVQSCGKAVCSPHDNFNRLTGRKVALAHALVVYDKEFRSKVWEEYKKISRVV
jgi:hypothetical protein